MVMTTVITIQCCQEDHKSMEGTRYVKFLVKCLVYHKYWKVLAIIIISQSCRGKFILYHMCSCCCGVNKPEPHPRFSLYLITHTWVFLPVIFLHPSSLRHPTAWANKDSNSIHGLSYLTTPIRESSGRCNNLTHCYDEAKPTKLTLRLAAEHQVIYYFKTLQEVTLDFTRLKSVFDWYDWMHPCF